MIEKIVERYSRISSSKSAYSLTWWPIWKPLSRRRKKISGNALAIRSPQATREEKLRHDPQMLAENDVELRLETGGSRGAS